MHNLYIYIIQYIMNNLLKKYVTTLTVDKLNKLLIENNIILNNNDLLTLLNIIKDNFDDILINDTKYLNILKEKLDTDNYNKIEKLFNYYKNRYKGYLF